MKNAFAAGPLLSISLITLLTACAGKIAVKETNRDTSGALMVPGGIWL